MSTHNFEDRFKIRLMRHLEDIKKSENKNFCNFTADESNPYFWRGLIVPDNPPYNKGAFRIEMVFPKDFPFKPPTVDFVTKIYHPNVTEIGGAHWSEICYLNWRPATKPCKILQSLVDMLHDPSLFIEHNMRADVAAEYRNDRNQFYKTAEAITMKYAEKRPSEN